MLTKTDYLHFLESPMHLWAHQHGWLEDSAPSPYDQHLMAQGAAVEKLAQEFLREHISRQHPQAELSFQPVYTDDNYYARLDAAVYHPDTGVTDIYEIKSASSVKKEHLFDAAFQQLVAEANFAVGQTFILHINKEYQRQGDVELSQLFVIENVDEQITSLREELLAGREAAWNVTLAESRDEIEACFKPKNCPCPRLCHPRLPDHSIYDLPRMRTAKLKDLRDTGIVAVEEIPAGYPLSGNQRLHADVMRTTQPSIDIKAVQESLNSLVYPLYFLDYETFNPAVPWYDGYAPYQQMVFQYSLHVVEHPAAEPVHYECLAVEEEDPAPYLLAHLINNIGESGSVIVWNQPFEAGRNREMAAMFPEFAGRLENINNRMYDLMLVFSMGSYVHPDFHGSASIKNVLPVVVPDLSYEGLPIPAGDAAMLAWMRIMREDISPEKREETCRNLLRYCELDTLAMVKIWQALANLTG